VVHLNRLIPPSSAKFDGAVFATAYDRRSG
jgi:hypothetical protein